MLTMRDIEELERRWKEVNDLTTMIRFMRDFGMHTGELLARAKAFERVMEINDDSTWLDGFSEKVECEIVDFVAAAAKGFRP